MGDDTMYPPDPPRAGVAALIFSGDELLMIKRKGSHGAGTWSVPGGWMDFGESPDQSVKREVKEEVNLDVRPLRFLHATNWVFYADKVQSVCLWWLCQPIAPGYYDGIRNNEPDKIETMCWIPYREVEDGTIEGAVLFPHLALFIEEFTASIPVPGLQAVHEILRRRDW